jgi:hypothetical protein
MKKTLLSLLLVLAAPLAIAQNKYFTVYKDKNRLEYPQCKANHRVLLMSYRNQLDSEISRLLIGIDSEESAKAPKIRINAYYKLLLELSVKRVVIDEMINQLDRFDFNQFKTTEGLKKTVFNTDAINVNIKDKVGKTLEAALAKYNRNELSEHVVDTIKMKLFTNTVTAVGGHILKSVGSGLIANISGNALKGALLSIGSEALVGAVQGGIISLLAIPLMGNRLPMETAWLDLLGDHPEIIINPEWMRKAKSQDHPWVAHCYTILRETKRLEKILDSNLTKEERSFINSVTSIYKLEDPTPLTKPDNSFKRDYPTVAIDNTYVRKPVIIHDIVPFWAQRR